MLEKKDIINVCDISIKLFSSSSLVSAVLSSLPSRWSRTPRAGSRFFVFFFFLALVLTPAASYAAVSINELMYDAPGTDTGREWVEILNSGPDPVTIGTGSGNGSWRFSDSSAHTLTLAIGENVIPAGGYAIVAKDLVGFFENNPGFSGTVFTSSISLNNSGATLSLKDGSGNIADSITYDSGLGASGDGNTLQKQNDGSWAPAAPTLGAENGAVTTATASASSTSSIISSTSSSSTGSAGPVATISTHYSYLPLSAFNAALSLAITAGRDRLSAAGGPVAFHADANIDDSDVIYQWNFGDGSTGAGKDVVHRYAYPGSYIVVLNGASHVASAVSRANVEVTQSDLEIASANSEYISVHNGSGYEVNLYGWRLYTNGSIFEFPRDTIIGAGGTVYFPTGVTHLSPSQDSDVVISLEA